MASGLLLFGEASQGSFEQAYVCRTLWDLYKVFGEPTPSSCGITCAVQAILKNKLCCFWRIHEEGLALEDYRLALERLDRVFLPPDPWQGLFLPGLSDPEIIRKAMDWCHLHQRIFLMDPRDFQDWLMS